MKLKPYSMLVLLIGLVVLVSDALPQPLAARAPQAPREDKVIYFPLMANNYCADAYTDDFADPNSGWLVADLPIIGIGLSYQEGEYEIELRQGNIFAGAPAPLSGLTQYSVEAEMHRQTGSTSQYALAFDQVDLNHFYIFVVDPGTQKYAIGKRDGSDWVVVAAWSSSPYIHPGNERNRLAVSRYGSQITVSVNNHPLTTAFDNAFSGNLKVGVYAQTGDDVPAAVRFDNFRVCGGTTSGHASTTPILAAKDIASARPFGVSSVLR